MLSLEELVLLAAAKDPDGVVEYRKLRTETGWIRVFGNLVNIGYLDPFAEDIPEPGPGDYLLSTYQITSKGKRAAAMLSLDSPG